MTNSLLGSLLGGGTQTQQQANTNSYGQAAAQAQNYQSQSPNALAQAYTSVTGGFQSQSMGAMVRQGQLTQTGSSSIGMLHDGTIVGQLYTTATSTEIEHEAYETPVAMLIDLWVTRFGNEWVDLETIDNDEFFSKACKRLKQMGQLEIHYLTDRARYVCRKPK